MMKDNILKLKNAYANYNLNNTYMITQELLKYILERINANKKEIEDLIEIRKEQVTFEEIYDIAKKEIEDEINYKNYKKMQINKNGFISTSILMPIGIIAVEAFGTKEVLKYILRAIKSRNALAISDVEYDEMCVKFLLLEIIKQALIKFKIDSNLIMILPYEECFYEGFDKVIYTYNENGKILKKNKYETREKTDDLFVYIQDESLHENAIRDNENVTIIDKKFDDAINKINEKKSLGAVIYTTDSNLAYKFINLVHSQNVMVNASLENAEKTPDSIQEMYEYENIIIPIPKIDNENITNKKNDEKDDVEYLLNQKVLDDENQELSLVEINDGIFAKIKNFLKRLFK